MCLYPKLINNPKYKANKKNNFNPPVCKDERVKLVPIGCGKCMECMKKKQREWTVRLNEELRTNNQAKFITLTFSNEEYTKLYHETKNKYKNTEGYELDNQIATTAVRRFLERYRKKYKKSIKHWLITEIGGTNTEGLHLHGILFKNIDNKELTELWKYGRTDNGQYVNERTINYITKYVTKTDQKHSEYKPVILTSPGIGSNYINRPDSQNNKFKQTGTNETYRTRNGLKTALPIYYRNKIYNEEQREELWLQKLDKEQRWICGEKVSIKDGQQQYEQLLKYYQQKNEKLGYGTDKQNWNEKKYQQDRRTIKQLTKINKQKYQPNNQSQNSR